MHNSSTYSDSDHDVSVEEGYLRKFANQMLKGRIFIGTYHEKRYVEPLNNYRDIVFVNPSELDLIKSLKIILNRIGQKYNNSWMGITEHNNSFNLWVQLENQVFGSFWYTVKRVKFRNNEILLQLTQVRPVEEAQDNVKVVENDLNLNVSATTDIFKEKLVKAATDLWILLTYENIKSAVIFLSILCFAAITFIGNTSKFLIIQFLRFMREISIFITSVTPIIQSVIALIERVIGWFFIFIAMIWKDIKNPAPCNRSHQNMLQYNNMAQQRKMLGYKKNGVVITEIID